MNCPCSRVGRVNKVFLRTELDGSLRQVPYPAERGVGTIEIGGVQVRRVMPRDEADRIRVKRSRGALHLDITKAQVRERLECLRAATKHVLVVHPRALRVAQHRAVVLEKIIALDLDDVTGPAVAQRESRHRAVHLAEIGHPMARPPAE